MNTFLHLGINLLILFTPNLMLTKGNPAINRTNIKCKYPNANLMNIYAHEMALQTFEHV